MITGEITLKVFLLCSAASVVLGIAAALRHGAGYGSPSQTNAASPSRAM